jgi:hypothetical protein
MKICGTVVRPPARWIISSRLPGSDQISKSVKVAPLRLKRLFARAQ